MVKVNSKKLSSTRNNASNNKKQAQNNMLLAQNEFSSALFGQFVQENGNGNLIISPFSIYIAMMNCMLGTGGETLREMIDGLFLRESFNSCKMENAVEQFQKWKESELKQYSGMIKNIVQNESVLSIANRIYLEKSLGVKNEFINELVDQFDSQTQLANFKGMANIEVKNINAWVASNTKNNIKNLISKLDSDTLMVIVNAIYFNGKWKHQFNKNRTIEKSFNTLNGECNCQMMSLEDCKSKFLYEEMDDYQILQLPYTDEEYCMTFIKPNDDLEIDEENETEFNKWLQSKLTDISRLNPSESVKMNRIQIPKFKFEKQFDNIIPTIAKKPFEINRLFSPTNADFSNMLSNPQVDGVCVSQIIHKACIQVDESGTVASAATAVACKRKRRAASEEVYEFIADRPFAFILHHVPTQSVLFVGKINEITSN
ncbi:predicted protein [Naegleria gruberi]|uniref:Predicted protein n=1 Tax=Naegleria gruberi TaxID=5762 RepID=D2VVD1_NAEGR|nr:uncharacterized protein NAEGRDRAFT_72973 [Naegleria gruberi]EFC39288.1 predicted protein [Naegleria gruberi]|eukprot:XP_002672032.1 predicted protein [Naegleria gruberi strain NEG-M]